VAEDWDRDQQEVIDASPDSRLLVDAGPGNGKTAVACARIAHMINDWGIEAVNVLLVSFTRTAVAELRNRIAAYVGSPARAAGIRIATLDSTTWTLLNGFDSESASLFGGYDANIERLCDQLRQRNEDLLEILLVHHLRQAPPAVQARGRMSPLARGERTRERQIVVRPRAIR
jgi:superfamily I DNA/RNA helicase